MSLRPFFCYYGGKWRAAPKYPLPEHDTIVEPFAGAAGYATCYHDHKVVLVERDPIVAGLWRYLTRVTQGEIIRIPDIPEGGSVDDLPVCQEARYLVGFWLNKGASAPRKSPSSWMRSGVRAKSYWGHDVRILLATQVEQIRHWKVIEGSYESAPSIEATWFVDPPYQKAGKHYRFSKIDFRALAFWVEARNGLTITCENVGADWLPFVPFLRSKASPAKHGGKASLEAIHIRRMSMPLSASEVA